MGGGGNKEFLGGGVRNLSSLIGIQSEMPSKRTSCSHDPVQSIVVHV